MKPINELVKQMRRGCLAQRKEPLTQKRRELMENGKQLTKTNPGSAITPWADRQDVRELGERLQTMMPGAKKLKPAEALALAQAAVAHGLDPFNGELWYIPGSGLMAGIKGHRRSAHRQIEAEGGGNYWPEFEVLDTDEKSALGIPPAALAYRCKIRDTRTVEHYVKQIKDLLTAGLDWEIVSDLIGSRPYTEGVGYAEKTERSKMTLVQRAMKRAEADALKRRFDLPFGIAVGTSSDKDVVEAEWVVEEQDDKPRISQDTLERSREVLHGTAEEADWDGELFETGEDEKAETLEPATNGRPYSPTDTIYRLRHNASWRKGDADDYSDAHRPPDDEQEPPEAKQVQRIAALMGKALKRNDAGDPTLERHSVLDLAFGVSSGKMLTLKEATAIAKWLEAEPGAWIPSGVAAEECRLMLRTAMVEAGQGELELDAD